MDNRPTRGNGRKRTSRLSGKDKLRRKNSLLRRDGPLCHWCHAEFTDELLATIDHLLPLKDGGSDRLENLVLACEPCNNGRANPPLGRRKDRSDG